MKRTIGIDAAVFLGLVGVGFGYLLSRVGWAALDIPASLWLVGILYGATGWWLRGVALRAKATKEAADPKARPSATAP